MSESAHKSPAVRTIGGVFISGMAATIVSIPAMGSDLGGVLRDLRDARDISRHGKQIYEQVQSVTKPSTAARQDTLPSDGSNIVFYSASWCGYCNKARDYMRRNSVAFVEYDTESSAQGRADYRALNARGVPILLIGQQRMNGWSESQFRQLYGKFKTPDVRSTQEIYATTGRTTDRAPATRRLNSHSAAFIGAGTVLAAKIDKVPVFTSNSREAAVVTRLKKGEEVVAVEAAVGELIAVESAVGSGWVDKRLVRVQEN